MAYDVHRCCGDDSERMSRSLLRNRNLDVPAELLEELLEDEDCFYDSPRPLNEVEAFAELMAYAEAEELLFMQVAALPPGRAFVGRVQRITITGEECDYDGFYAYELLRERFPLLTYEVTAIDMEEREDTDYHFSVVPFHHSEHVGISDRQHWLVLFDPEELVELEVAR